MRIPPRTSFATLSHLSANQLCRLRLASLDKWAIGFSHVRILMLTTKNKNEIGILSHFYLVRIRGFEPPRRQPTHGPEPCASANSAISAHWLCVVHATALIYIICVTNASIIFTFLKKVWARHKPGSVLDDHLSRLTVTDKLQPSTSRTATGRRFLCPI